MIAADASVADPKTLSKLRRVRRMRLDAAEAELKTCQQVLRNEEAALEMARDQLRTAEHTLIDFRNYVVGEGAANLATMSATYTRYRESLDLRIAGCQQAVERGVNVVRNAKTKVDEALAVWRRAMARCDALDEVLKRSRVFADRREQNQLDEEIGDRVVVRLSHAITSIGR